MKANGLQGRKKHRRGTRTTDSRHAHPLAENLLTGTAVPTGPNQAWVPDITYIETGEGWLYLAAILDVWSRRVVGWTSGPTLHVSLVLAALQAALASAGLVRSMSRRDNCYDNPATESFGSPLKTETCLDSAVPISRRAA